MKTQLIALTLLGSLASGHCATMAEDARDSEVTNIHSSAAPVAAPAEEAPAIEYFETQAQPGTSSLESANDENADQAIPETSAFALLGIAGVGLLLRRRP